MKKRIAELENEIQQFETEIQKKQSSIQQLQVNINQLIEGIFTRKGGIVELKTLISDKAEIKGVNYV